MHLICCSLKTIKWPVLCGHCFYHHHNYYHYLYSSCTLSTCVFPFCLLHSSSKIDDDDENMNRASKMLRFSPLSCHHLILSLIHHFSIEQSYSCVCSQQKQFMYTQKYIISRIQSGQVFLSFHIKARFIFFF